MYIHTVPEIAALVRDRRQALGLSQAAVAARIGASRQWLVAFEGGQPNVELAPVLGALRLLGLRIAVTSADAPLSAAADASGTAATGVNPPSSGAAADGVHLVLDRLRPPRRSTPRTDR